MPMQPKYLSPSFVAALVFSGICLPLSAAAQDEEPVLQEVTVEADKLQSAADAHTVSTGHLEQLRPATSDTASLLSSTPGVSLYGAGGVSSLPAIHGLADDRLRIKVDGMDLIASCPNHMNPALSYIDPANVGELTTYAGVTPVSVGGDSIGGTIIAETREPVFAQGDDLLTQGELGSFYRSNGNVRGGNIAVAAASEHLNLSYSGSSVKSDNYKAADDFKTSTATGRFGHTLPQDEVGSSAYESINQTLGLALKGGNHLLDTQLSFQKIPEQLYPNQRMDMLENEQRSINTRYVGQFDWGELEAQVYEEKVGPHHMDFGDDKRVWYSMMGPTGMPCAPIGPGCAYGMPMDTESTNTGVNLKADINLDAQNLLRVGGLYQNYSLDDWWEPSGGMMGPSVFVNINNGQRDRTGVFSEWESRINSQWMTLLGIRYESVDMNTGDVQGYNPNSNGSMMMPSNEKADAAAFNAVDHERKDDNWDLTALTRYTPNANADIELGVSRKTRSPNLYERYTWSTSGMGAIMNNFVGDGNGYIGNINLDPEVANTISATFDFHSIDRKWVGRATPFYSRVDDYIDAVRCTSGAACTPSNLTARNQFVALKYENQEAELYGIDLSGQMPLASTTVGDFGLEGLVNYTHGENLDTEDDLYNIMPLNAKLSLTHKFGGWDNGIELVAAAKKDDVSGVRNEIKTPGYGITNLRTSYSWEQVRVDVGVDNVFDKMYYDPLGGAYVGQGTTMGINSIPWGVGVPGMGRSVYAGVTYKF